MTNRKITKCLSIKLLLVISLFFVATATKAQNKIQVTSFNRMETDVTARITAPQRDQNGEVCALIRIVTTEKDLMFEPDALGIVSRENKPGEIWLYIPRGARRISIMHDKFGVLRNYFYPDIIGRSRSRAASCSGKQQNGSAVFTMIITRLVSRKVHC